MGMTGSTVIRKMQCVHVCLDKMKNKCMNVRMTSVCVS